MTETSLSSTTILIHFLLLPNRLDIGVFDEDPTEGEDCDDERLIPRENLSSLAFRFDPDVEVVVLVVDPAVKLLFFKGFAFLVIGVAAAAPRLLLLLPPLVIGFFFAAPPRVLANMSSSLSTAPSKVSLSVSLIGSDMSDKLSSSKYASESL